VKFFLIFNFLQMIREKISDDEEEQTTGLLEKRGDEEKVVNKGRRGVCKIIGVWSLIVLAVVSLRVGLQVWELKKLANSRFSLIQLSFQNDTVCSDTIRMTGIVEVKK
jgi:hypothetical protein